jgi:hypothetical protein
MKLLKDTRLINGQARLAISYTASRSLAALPEHDSVIEGLIGFRADDYVEAIIWIPYEALDGGAFAHHPILPKLIFGSYADNLEIRDLTLVDGPERGAIFLPKLARRASSVWATTRRSANLSRSP